MQPIQKFALIVAGGTGTRLGAGIPKQLIKINAKPILVHTLQRFLDFDPEIVVCIVLHSSLLSDWEELLETYFPIEVHSQLLFCEGGEQRMDSVFNGLQYLQEYNSQNGSPPCLVAIHDGVRPFIDSKIIQDAYSQAEEKGNAVCAVPIKSSLRRNVEGQSQAVDRSEYFEVQTPQTFWLKDILNCYKNRSQDLFTDDASLAESQGMSIFLCQGSYNNIKITTSEDLALARIMMGE